MVRLREWQEYAEHDYNGFQFQYGAIKGLLFLQLW